MTARGIRGLVAIGIFAALGTAHAAENEECEMLFVQQGQKMSFDGKGL